MSCPSCRDTGFQFVNGWGSPFCICREGIRRLEESAARKAANRRAIHAYVANGSEPDLRPVASPDDLQQRIDAIRADTPPKLCHKCRGCDCDLLPGQPCGAYCKRCNEERMSLAPKTSDGRGALALFIVGLALLAISTLLWIGALS